MAGGSAGAAAAASDEDDEELVVRVADAVAAAVLDDGTYCNLVEFDDVPLEEPDEEELVVVVEVALISSVLAVWFAILPPRARGSAAISNVCTSS